VWRNVAITLGGILLVLISAVAAVVLTLPADRVGALFAAGTERALGREVSIASARPRVLPRPAVSLERVAVGAPAGLAAAAPVATADRLDLRIRLRPLLRGRIVIDEIVLRRPLVAVVVGADGSTNLPTLELPSPERDGRVEISIRSLSVRGGELSYTDERDGSFTRLRELDQVLHVEGAAGAGETVLTGRFRGRADLAMPGRMSDRPTNVPVALTHRLVLEREGRLRVEEGSLRVAGIDLEVSGQVDAEADGVRRAVELTLRTGRVDAARTLTTLGEILPAAMAGALADGTPRLAGPVRAVVGVSGPAGSGGTPTVRFAVALDGANVRMPGRDVDVDRLEGVVRYAAGRVWATELTGRLWGEPIRGGFDIADVESLRGSVSLRSTVDVRRAVRAGLVPEEWSGSGRVAFSLTASGPLRDPGRLSLDGTLRLHDLRVGTPALPGALLVRDAALTLRGQELSGAGVAFRLGGTDGTVDFRLREWLPGLVGGADAGRPWLGFDMRSARMDVADFVELETRAHGYGDLFLARMMGGQVDGREPGEVAAEYGLALPVIRAFDFEGRIAATEWVQGGTVLRDLRVGLASSGGKMEVLGGEFLLDEAGARVAGAIGRGGAGVPIPLRLRFSFRDTGQDEFFGRFTALRGHVRGSAAIEGSVSMLLDERLLPIAETQVGEGTVELTGGEFRGWPLARAIGERLGVGGFDRLEVRSNVGGFHLAGRSVALDGWVLEAGSMTAAVGGSFTLTGLLDLEVGLALPPGISVLARGTPAATVLAAASGSGGSVPVGLRIRGIAARPAVQVDLSAATRLAAESARQRVATGAVDAARRAAEARVRGPGPDAERDPAESSVPAATDPQAGGDVPTEILSRPHGVATD
jgi:hypothetical protein